MHSYIMQNNVIVLVHYPYQKDQMSLAPFLVQVTQISCVVDHSLQMHLRLELFVSLSPLSR